MKILSAAQVKEADAYTISHEPISSWQLMERASEAFVKVFCQHYQRGHGVAVLCGTGNNGGDGLAIARILQQRGYDVAAFVTDPKGKGSDDFKANYKKFKAMGSIHILSEEKALPQFSKYNILIDALLGSGLSRPLEGWLQQLVDHVNQLEKIIVAVDIATGLMDDRPADPHLSVMEVQRTISFQVPKLAFLMPENLPYVGEWEIVDIRLHPQVLTALHSDYTLLTPAFISQHLKSRGAFQHKGDFGRLLIFAGSLGKAGAALLCANAALHSGVGLLTVHAPGSATIPLQTAIPEAMISPDAHHDFISQLPDIAGYNAIAIGPGIGQHELTKETFEALLNQYDQPMVVDADGLNILASKPELFNRLPENSILTPHPGEFKRLVGDFDNSLERLEKQQAFARQHKVILLVKGRYSSIAMPNGKVFFNATGNAGMATGGSGDALTGMIAALLAQQYNPEIACIIAVYLHGKAGDLAAKKHSMLSMTPSLLIGQIGKAWKTIGGQ